MNGWFLYILRCKDGSLYTGIATDVQRRLQEHQAGGRLCARYLRGRAPLLLVYHQAAGSKSQALRLELQVKRLSKKRKEALVAVGVPLPLPPDQHKNAAKPAYGL